jgi:hypothetical protein
MAGKGRGALARSGGSAGPARAVLAQRAPGDSGRVRAVDRSGAENPESACMQAGYES